MMFVQQKSNIAMEIGHTKPCDEILLMISPRILVNVQKLLH